MGMAFLGESTVPAGLCVFCRSGVIETGDQNGGKKVMQCVDVLQDRNICGGVLACGRCAW